MVSATGIIGKALPVVHVQFHRRFVSEAGNRACVYFYQKVKGQNQTFLPEGIHIEDLTLYA